MAYSCMRVDLQLSDEEALLTLAGEFDIATLAELTAGVHAATHSGRRRLVVDLAAVNFLCVRSVLAIAEGCEAFPGWAELRHADPTLVRLLTICGKRGVIPHISSVGRQPPALRTIPGEEGGAPAIPVSRATVGCSAGTRKAGLVPPISAPA